MKRTMAGTMMIGRRECSEAGQCETSHVVQRDRPYAGAECIRVREAVRASDED